MEEQHYALGEMDRRLSNLLRFGTIAAVKYASGALVQVDIGDLVTDWVPFASPRAGKFRVWMPPSVGEQVALLSSGDPSQGVAFGGLFQDAHPENGNADNVARFTCDDGTVLEYDMATAGLRLAPVATGSATVAVGSSTMLVNDSKIALTSNGNTLEISAAGVKHNGVNIGATHTHADPQGGNTDVPH